METTKRRRRGGRLAKHAGVQCAALRGAIRALEDSMAIEPRQASRALAIASIDWCTAHAGTVSDQLRAVLAESL